MEVPRERSEDPGSGASKASLVVKIPQSNMTPEQARWSDLAKIMPNDRFADLGVTVGSSGSALKSYKLHRAVVCPQSKFFNSSSDHIDQAGDTVRFTFRSVETFDRVLSWLYRGNGANDSDDLQELQHLYRCARLLGILPLRLQILTTIASPEYQAKLSGETPETVVGFLNEVYGSIDSADFSKSWGIMDALCTKFMEKTSAGLLIDLLERGNISKQFKKHIRDKLQSARVLLLGFPDT
ncbi:hypothetical protein TWF281_003743 [Arthrobotrys megalospora]